MQLYKGVNHEEENNNWTNPVALAENKQAKEIENSKQLFLSKCASCHSIGKESVAPDIAHFMKRFQGEKLFARWQLINNPYYFEEGARDTARKIDSNFHQLDDIKEIWYNQLLYFCNLKSIYGTLGTQFPDLNEEALNSIYRYIQNESDKEICRFLPLPTRLVVLTAL